VGGYSTFRSCYTWGAHIGNCTKERGGERGAEKLLGVRQGMKGFSLGKHKRRLGDNQNLVSGKAVRAELRNTGKGGRIAEGRKLKAPKRNQRHSGSAKCQKVGTPGGKERRLANRSQRVQKRIGRNKGERDAAQNRVGKNGKKKTTKGRKRSTELKA